MFATSLDRQPSLQVQKTLSSLAIEKVEDDKKEEVGGVKEEAVITSTLMESTTEDMDVSRPVSPPTATLQSPRLQFWADKLLSAIAMALIVSIIAVVLFKFSFIHSNHGVISTIRNSKER
eukprot:99398_1